MNKHTENTVELLTKLGLSASSVDPQLLQQALTHKSVIMERHSAHLPYNERLEYLGDAFLKSSISEWLFKHLEDAPEGQMSEIRAYVISDAALSRAAQRLELARYIRVSEAERAQGQIRDSILANVFESLCGVIFLSTDFRTTAGIILEQLKPELKLAVYGEAAEVQNYKAIYQEYTQSKYKTLPDYQLLETEGPDHERTFHVVAYLNGEEQSQGSGRSKKRAEQDAAHQALLKLNLLEQERRMVPEKARQFFESAQASLAPELPSRLVLAPSVLSADFACLQTALAQIEAAQAAWVHLDVMDGHFVPNLTFGPPVIKALRPHSSRVFDAHLMITNPDDYLADFQAAGCDRLTVHYEVCRHLDRTIAQIAELGMKPGVSLNPATPVEVLEDILHKLELVLIMSVNPGFGGQKFINRALDKIKRLVQLRNAQGLAERLLIQVDGGIDEQTLPGVIKAGADVVVMGSAVFNTPDPVLTISQYHAQLKRLETQI